jgi:hypothetical protein
MFVCIYKRLEPDCFYVVAMLLQARGYLPANTWQIEIPMSVAALLPQLPRLCRELTTQLLQNGCKIVAPFNAHLPENCRKFATSFPQPCCKFTTKLPQFCCFHHGTLPLSLPQHCIGM